MYYSQCDQDKYLHMNVFKDYKSGVFVDVGAHDGKTFNNTLFFEENYKWSGINIEPIPDVYKKLQVNRYNCINLCNAIDISNNILKEFMINTGHTEMLSGLIEKYDARHMERINYENTKYNCSSNTIKVVTRTLESIFEEYNINNINYLSIDVEGAEFSVIKSINFNKVFIDVIMFENNYDNVSIPIIEYLEKFGYKVLNKDQDITMIHKESMFLINT